MLRIKNKFHIRKKIFKSKKNKGNDPSKKLELEKSKIKKRKKPSAKKAPVFSFVFTQDLRIQFPQVNCVYYIKNQAFPKGAAAVTFEGEVSTLAYFNLANFTYQFRDENVKYVLLPDDKRLVSKHALAVNTEKSLVSPITFYSQSHFDHLYTLREINIDIDKEKIAYRFFCSKIPGIEIGSKTLQEECQKLAGDIPIMTGKYPLFVDHKRPDFAFLATLYHQFMQYNDPPRLAYQNKHSVNWCAARAHAMTLFLNQYRVTSYKLFKRWDALDWKEDSPEFKKGWRYHCGTMIIDSDNNKWVWEPWVGNNHYLLAFENWLRVSDEPIPIKLLVTNSWVLDDFRHGKEVYIGEKIRKTGRPFFNAFQMTMTCALPNSPERPISTKNKEDSIRKKVETNKNMLFFRPLFQATKSNAVPITSQADKSKLVLKK